MDCKKHRVRQHRDGLPPWCEECGYTNEVQYQAPKKVGKSAQDRYDNSCKKIFQVDVLIYSKDRTIRNRVDTECPLERDHPGPCQLDRRAQLLS